MLRVTCMDQFALIMARIRASFNKDYPAVAWREYDEMRIVLGDSVRLSDAAGTLVANNPAVKELQEKHGFTIRKIKNGNGVTELNVKFKDDYE